LGPNHTRDSCAALLLLEDSKRCQGRVKIRRRWVQGQSSLVLATPPHRRRRLQALGLFSCASNSEQTAASLSISLRCGVPPAAEAVCPTLRLRRPPVVYEAAGANIPAWRCARRRALSRCTGGAALPRRQALLEKAAQSHQRQVVG